LNKEIPTPSLILAPLYEFYFTHESVKSLEIFVEKLEACQDCQKSSLFGAYLEDQKTLLEGRIRQAYDLMLQANN
jgi:hypothetical protein